MDGNMDTRPRGRAKKYYEQERDELARLGKVQAIASMRCVDGALVQEECNGCPA